MDLTQQISRYYDDWKVGASYLWRTGSEQLSSLIQANPRAYEGTVTSFLYALRAAQQNLDRMRSKLPTTPSTPSELAQVDRYAQLEARYKILATDFFADTQPTTKSTVGFVPVMILAALAIGLTAATIGVSGYQYATNLREQTALAAKELEARVTLAQQGIALPESTLKPQTDPIGEIGNTVSTVAKVGVLGLLAWGGFRLLQRS